MDALQTILNEISFSEADFHPEKKPIMSNAAPSSSDFKNSRNFNSAMHPKNTKKNYFSWKSARFDEDVLETEKINKSEIHMFKQPPVISEFVLDFKEN